MEENTKKLFWSQLTGVGYKFILILFMLLTGYFILCGTAFWNGGDTAYLQTNVVLRTLQMISGVLLLGGIFYWIAQRLKKASSKRLWQITPWSRFGSSSFAGCICVCQSNRNSL